MLKLPLLFTTVLVLLCGCMLVSSKEGLQAGRKKGGGDGSVIQGARQYAVKYDPTYHNKISKRIFATPSEPANGNYSVVQYAVNGSIEGTETVPKAEFNLPLLADSFPSISRATKNELFALVSPTVTEPPARLLSSVCNLVRAGSVNEFESGFQTIFSYNPTTQKVFLNIKVNNQGEYEVGQVNYIFNPAARTYQVADACEGNPLSIYVATNPGMANDCQVTGSLRVNAGGCYEVAAGNFPGTEDVSFIIP